DLSSGDFFPQLSSFRLVDMTVDAGQAGMNHSEPADVLGFSPTNISRIDREWSEETGQTGSEDGEATGTQLTTGSNHRIKSTNCEQTAGGTLKQMAHNSIMTPQFKKTPPNWTTDDQINVSWCKEKSKCLPLAKIHFQHDVLYLSI
uniref:Uncharacterized protein n=1 Tax=Takifugu rubripes TaxID=31033 RepID=A0A674MHE2_TAKRU